MMEWLELSYWRWLFYGSGGRPGISRLLDWWIVLHAAIGITLALVVPSTLEACANAVLLPLAGIIIGLAFAWAGNAQALLQTSEVDELGGHHKGGFVEYVYVYQLAIMLILSTLIVWSLAGMRVFDGTWPTRLAAAQYFAVKTLCFVLSSIALRECWHVVLGAQWMLLAQRNIKRAQRGR